MQQHELFFEFQPRDHSSHARFALVTYADSSQDRLQTLSDSPQIIAWTDATYTSAISLCASR